MEMNVDNPAKLTRAQSLNNLLVQNPSAAPMIPINSQGPIPTNIVPRDREMTSFSNLFTTRTRRFSASCANNPGLLNQSPGSPCLAPRVSQLRQEECAELSNLRELNHEREIQTQIQISQSCDDLTLFAENWSVSAKSQDDFSNPLHVALPSSLNSACSSPSPTSRHSARLPSVMSPSPTRRATFQTRRSMSPIAIRPSPLSSIKRKFDMIDDCSSLSSSSSQPFKKIFTESRGSSPIYQIPLSPLPLSICPSPDSSSTYNDCNNGRLTPKLFVSKILNKYASDERTANSLSSTSSPLSSEHDSSPSSSIVQTTMMDLGNEDAVLSQSEVVSSSDNTNNISDNLNIEMDSVSSSQIIKNDNDKAPSMLVDDITIEPSSNLDLKIDEDPKLDTSTNNNSVESEITTMTNDDK